MPIALAKRGTSKPGDFVETLNFLAIAHSHYEQMFHGKNINN